MRFRAIFGFEVIYQLRRRSTWLYFAVVTALAFRLATEAFLNGAVKGGYFFNGPFVVAAVSAVGSMFGLLVIAAVAADAATRDVQTRMEPLLYTTPVTKAEYLAGRFLAAFAVCGLLLAAVPLGFMLAGFFPGLGPELVGPFRPAAYLRSYVLFTLPNTFIATAILFSLALLSRRGLSAYVGGALLFVVPFFSNEFVAKLKGQWQVAKHVDPMGFVVMSELSRAWTPLEKSTRLLSLEGSLLSNRILWVSIAATVLALTHLTFRLAHPAAGTRRLRLWPRLRVSAAIADPARDVAIARSAAFAVPQVRRSFGAATRARQTLAIAARSFLMVLRSWGSLALGVVVLFLVASGPELMEHMGVPLFPTTERIIARLAAPGDLTGFIATFLIVFFAGELIWRERDAGMSVIVDATPVPDWVPLLGKFLGLTFVLVLLQALIMIGGILTQVRLGYFHFEIGVYLAILFGLQLTDYILFAALAVAVHVVVNQKYVGHLIVILAYALSQFPGSVGIEHNLLIYASDPGWRYSDMSGFDPYLAPFLWFKLYWAAWALLLAVAAKLLWVRGPERGIKERLRLARSRVSTPAAASAAAAVAVVLIVGSFIFYNTNVLNAHVSADERSERRAEYERRYGRYEAVRQPALAGTSLHVELYPERGTATIRGTYRLENKSSVTIDAIHLATASQVETQAVRMDRAFAPLLVDTDLGHRVYRLSEPLQPGESLRLSFDVRFERRGFPNGGTNPAVVANGTHFERDWLPAIGYQSNRELSNAGERKKHGLAPRPATPPVDDVAARHDTRGVERIPFEATIGTAPNQIAIAPGTLRRSWSQNGRRYFHYATDAPMRNGYAIFSADYAVRRSRWRHVDIEVVHHPGHGWNVENMVRGVQASLEYFTTHFGPYPHRQIRLVEAPGSGIGLRAHPINIRYFEGFGLLNPEADHRDFDFTFGVVAHEVAHQWWGNQLSPASVQGAALLSESLAWYSAISVVEETHGPEHLRRFLNLMRDAYLAPRARADVPLLRAADWFVAYRKGPFAMYALREYLGEERVSLALRRLLDKHGSGAPPLPTALDLYAELQAVTPESLRYLLTDLFEVNTFWELQAKEASAEPAADGTWRVTLNLSARKVAVDENGAETERPMNDLIEIGVFAAAKEGIGEPLHLQKHRIRAGDNRITVTVAAEPARAGIDPRNILIDTAWRDNTTDVKIR